MPAAAVVDANMAEADVAAKRPRRWSLSMASKTNSRKALRERLQRADTRRTLIAENAKFSRSVLQEFARIHRPTYNLCDAIWFGSFIDLFLVLHLQVGNPLIKAIIRHGGPEQIRFLFCVATFDADSNGQIDDEEWQRYERLGDVLIMDSIAMCGNMGIVGALLLGLTHLMTMGRPTAYVMSDASAAVFPEWILWVAYAFNVASESAAFFTLCLAVITRNNLTNVLPTRELKIDMLRSSNALGIMGVSLMITLWCFMISTILGTLVASPNEGAIGCFFFGVCMGSAMYCIAPIRYVAVLLLHEEVKRFMLDESGSFKAALSDADRLSVQTSGFGKLVQEAQAQKEAINR